MNRGQDIGSYSNLYAAFYDNGHIQKKGNVDVSVTDDTISGVYDLAFSKCYFLYDDKNLMATPQLKWSITDSNSTLFTYTDTSHVPYSTILSDTLTSDSATAFLYASFANADSVGIIIDSSQQYYYKPKDTIALDLALFGITSKQRAAFMTVTAYKHTYHSMNGYNYLFIKSQQVTQKIWLK